MHVSRTQLSEKYYRLMILKPQILPTFMQAGADALNIFLQLAPDLRVLPLQDLTAVVARSILLIMAMVVMPAAVREDDAATKRQQGKYRNQPGDSTKHFLILKVNAAGSQSS